MAVAPVPAPRAWPEPVADRAVLTHKGQAVRAVYRLLRQLAELDADRAAVCSLLAAELADLPIVQ